VWDSSGTVIRYQGTLTDVTEKRTMELQIRQQEQFRQRMLESFPDLILVLDLEQRYTFASSRIRDLLGYRPEELVGKRIEELQDHSPEFLSLYRDVASGKQMFATSEYGALHRNGSWRTMRASASQLFDAENKLSGVIISVRDITVEKKLEQQIIQSERLAAMGQMLGGFAHELNNPVSATERAAGAMQQALLLHRRCRLSRALKLCQEGGRQGQIRQARLYRSAGLPRNIGRRRRRGFGRSRIFQRGVVGAAGRERREHRKGRKLEKPVTAGGRFSNYQVFAQHSSASP